MSKTARLLISLLVLAGLGAGAGLYLHYKLQEAQRPALPPEFEEKLRQSEAAEAAVKGVLDLERLRNLVSAAPDEAIRSIRAYIEAAPASPEASEARLLLADLLARNGDVPGALALLQAVVADPTAGSRASRARIERARLLAKSDPAAARRDLEAVLADDVHPPAFQHRARLELGLLELHSGQFLQAIATLTPLTQLTYAEKPEALEAIGQAVAGHADELAKGSDPAAILAWAEEMRKKFPGLDALQSTLRFHQAAALRKAGRLTEARTLAERLRRDDPALDAPCAAELARIADAEAAAGILRTPAAFLKAVAEGKEARTHVEGDIAADTVWPKAKAPIVLASKVTVKPGATLTIEPGCVVQFLLGTQLVVEGTLVARGTPEAPIRFTTAVEKAATPFDGDGILFADSSADDRCVLEHCIVEHQRVGVTCSAASPTLRRCLLARNGVAGLLATGGAQPRLEDLCRVESNDSVGIRASGADPTVRRCLILRNGGDGIQLADKAKATIEANRVRDNGGNGIALDNFAAGTIQANEIASNQGCGIRCNRFSQPSIQGNAIRDNRGSGIRCSLQSAPSILANFIEANRDHPITLERSDPLIKGNNIVGNRPYGLNCLRESSPQIEGNWIERNGGCGIICGEASAPAITRNAILGQARAINNGTSLTLQAANNYFGDVDDATVDKLIVDKGEEKTLGEVVWRPRLTAPPPRPTLPTLDLPPMQ